jgi:hypothetical protein
MKVTVEIDLNVDWVDTISQADETITELIGSSLDDSEAVVRWNVTKVEVTE